MVRTRVIPALLIALMMLTTVGVCGCLGGDDGGDTYDTTDDQSVPASFADAFEEDIKPSLADAFGGAKVTQTSDSYGGDMFSGAGEDLGTGEYVSFRLKDEVSQNTFQDLVDDLEGKGFELMDPPGVIGDLDTRMAMFGFTPGTAGWDHTHAMWVGASADVAVVAIFDDYDDGNGGNGGDIYDSADDNTIPGTYPSWFGVIDSVLEDEYGGCKVSELASTDDVLDAGLYFGGEDAWWAEFTVDGDLTNASLNDVTNELRSSGLLFQGRIGIGVWMTIMSDEGVYAMVLIHDPGVPQTLNCYMGPWGDASFDVETPPDPDTYDYGAQTHEPFNGTNLLTETVEPALTMVFGEFKTLYTEEMYFLSADYAVPEMAVLDKLFELSNALQTQGWEEYMLASQMLMFTFTDGETDHTVSLSVDDSFHEISVAVL